MSQSSESASRRVYDLVVWGATGFTGRLTALYLAEKLRAHPGTFCFAIAGRSEQKLLELQKALEEKFQQKPPILVGDSKNQKSVDEVVKQTRVLIAAAGPYTTLGLPVVDACVRLCTHYCDVTGEPNFMKAVAERYDEEAKQKGVHLVSACGLDCIPSDLGVLFVVTEARKRGHELHFVEGYISFESKGGGVPASGGTLNSMITIAEQPLSQLKELAGPFYLLPEVQRPAATRMDTNPLLPWYSRQLGRFTGFFPLSAGNGQVVRKSAHFKRYGSSFHYRESFAHSGGLLKSGATAVLSSWLFLVALLLLLFSFTRNLLRRILPQPGEGPSQQAMEQSRFSLRFFGHTADGRQVIDAALRGGAPYVESGRMLAETGLCLAFDKLNSKGGAETPAMACGEALIPRLQTIGIDFQLLQ
jgi:short subunit dehydrogenase-like uncharacterized protein